MEEIIIGDKPKTRKFNHHWKFCVNGENAAYALRHDYAKQLADTLDA